MFERFTDRSRKVMALANQEARRFNHEYIGTEHILLGLIKEGSGVGAAVLKNLNVDIKKLRLEVEKLVKRGLDMVTHGKLPQTPRAKKVIEYAIEESRSLNHKYVGTEHILLGLLRESEGIAAQVLMNLGLKLEDVREEVLNLVGPGNEIERFTDRARKVMALANQEAQRFNHEYIGTEHILLGLVKEGSGVGARVLKNLDVDIKKLRLEVEKLVKRGPDMVAMGKLPQTPRAKKVIKYAIEEARSLKHNYVGTEHILLGLLLEGEGIAAQVLMNWGLRIEQVRGEVLALKGEKEPVMEREPRTWNGQGEKKPLIKRRGLNMFDRFTDRARKIMALANQEAQRFNHEYIDTEHILLGLIKEGSGIGATILKNLHVDFQFEVERLLKRGPDRVTMGKLPQTQRAKKVIEYAIEETREMEKQLNRRLDVDTEHILLGLLREGEGIAAQVLMNLGLRIEQVDVFLALEREKEPEIERGPRTWEGKGKKKQLIQRKGKVSMNEDGQYLKLLSVFHYVVGGMAAFFACMFLFHFCIGVAMLTGAIDNAPIFVGLMFVIMATVAITFGWTLAVCIIIAGRCLAKRKRYMFCLVMAAISCIFMPFGTVLGVFTIIVLMRPLVKELFAAK